MTSPRPWSAAHSERASRSVACCQPWPGIPHRRMVHCCLCAATAAAPHCIARSCIACTARAASFATSPFDQSGLRPFQTTSRAAGITTPLHRPCCAVLGGRAAAANWGALRAPPHLACDVPHRLLHQHHAATQQQPPGEGRDPRRGLKGFAGLQPSDRSERRDVLYRPGHCSAARWLPLPPHRRLQQRPAR